MEIPRITTNQIIEQYDAILMDAFGVLVYQFAALPGAPEFIQKLNTAKKKYFILTNDSAHSIATSERRFTKFGFSLVPDCIITSGSLLVEYFRQNNLLGQGCAILGTKDSIQYVQNAGGITIPINEFDNWSVLVICDETGFPFLEYIEMALSALFFKIDQGKPIHLILCNPDCVYRKNANEFGITAGSIALILENALKMRYPNRQDLVFSKLGKPYLPIFQEALRRSGTKNMVMIGDQLAYDIRGAKNFGIPAILMGTGVTNLNTIQPNSLEVPDFILESW